LRHAALSPGHISCSLALLVIGTGVGVSLMAFFSWIQGFKKTKPLPWHAKYMEEYFIHFSHQDS